MEKIDLRIYEEILPLWGYPFNEPYQFLYFYRFRLLDTRNDGDISDEESLINLRSLWKNSIEFISSWYLVRMAKLNNFC